MESFFVTRTCAISELGELTHKHLQITCSRSRNAGIANLRCDMDLLPFLQILVLLFLPIVFGIKENQAPTKKQALELPRLSSAVQAKPQPAKSNSLEIPAQSPKVKGPWKAVQNNPEDVLKYPTSFCSNGKDRSTYESAFFSTSRNG